MTSSHSAQLESEVTSLREQVNELRRQLAVATRSSSVYEDKAIYGPTTEREMLLLEAERIAHTGSWVWNVETNQVFWSDELYRILGYSPETTPPSVEAFFAVVHPDDVDLVRKTSSEAARTGVTSRSLIRLRRSDGQVRFVQMDGASVYDGNGQLRRLIGTVLDVTEIRQSEQRLLHANQLLEEAQSLAHIGNWNMALSTLTGEWSDEFRRILGVSADVPASFELFNSCVHPDDLARLHETQQRSLQSPSLDEIDVRLMRPNGEIKYVKISAVAVADENGRPVALRGTMQDLTDMHRLRERLYEAERMEAIGRLAGGIAHDFNNLMMIVQGNLELLEAPERPELRAILEAVKGAKSLTTSLLAFGRKTSLQRQVIDLNSLVESTAKLLHRLIGKDIDLRVETATQPLLIDVDSSMFQQVLINLAINARDALSAGGSITITTRPSEKLGEKLVELVVRDTGAGIDPEIKDRIFEPFFTTKTLGAGSGMGLAMVHGTVLQHGGTIEVESQHGAGTAFIICIPLAGPSLASAVELSEPAPVQVNGTTILVVDDQPEIGELATAALKRNGYVVLSAQRPSSALALMRLHPEIELALCDLVMPEMHGTALAIELKKLKPTLPVVFMSGYSGASVSLPEGSKLLHKPFSLDELAAAITNELTKIALLTK